MEQAEEVRGNVERGRVNSEDEAENMKEVGIAVEVEGEVGGL